MAGKGEVRKRTRRRSDARRWASHQVDDPDLVSLKVPASRRREKPALDAAAQ